MNIAIIDYGAGNVQSVAFALNRLGIEPFVSNDPEAISKADKIIFPGVGEAGAAMRQLQKTGLDKLIPQLKQPVLGVCLGMQLMCAHSEESDTRCLDIFPYEVKHFPAGGKVPHMGWNDLLHVKAPLFASSMNGCQVYFVHSYYVAVSEHTIAATDHILPFSAAIAKDNFFAVQFHPEKSGAVGEEILQNFLKLDITNPVTLNLQPLT